jgi:EmrB/QacA subfamily drug resistance transporter
MALSRGWKVLLVTSAGVYLVSLDVTIVNIAFRDINADFTSASPALLSWVLSGYNIAFAASLLTAGRMADRFGRRRAFFTGLAVFTISSALCGAAPGPAWLIGARVLQAVGGALIIPSSLALILPEFPLERRSAAIGMWGAIGAVAAATGPSLGGFLVDAVGWRAVFYVNMPVCLLAFAFGRSILLESKDPTATGVPDVLGAALGTLGIGALTLSIVQGGEWGYGDRRTVVAYLVAALALPAFVLRCNRIDNPVLDLALLRQRFFAVANTAGFLFSIGFFAMLFVNVQFLTGVWGYSVAGAGLALTPGPLFAAICAGPAGRLADRYGHRVVAGPGAVLFAAGILWYILRLGPEPDYWGVFFPGNAVAGTGIGFTISTLGSASSAFLPPTRFAMGSAFNATARQIGAALGIAMVVAVLGTPSPADAPAAFDRAWGILAAFGVSGGILMLALFRPPAREGGATTGTAEVEAAGTGPVQAVPTR